MSVRAEPFGKLRAGLSKPFLRRAQNDRENRRGANGSFQSTEPKSARGIGGAAVLLNGRIAKVRCALQVDLGFGEPVTPAPKIVVFPVLLDDLAAPTLRVCHGLHRDRREVSRHDISGLGQQPHERLLRHRHHRPPNRARRRDPGSRHRRHLCAPQNGPPHASIRSTRLYGLQARWWPAKAMVMRSGRPTAPVGLISANNA